MIPCKHCAGMGYTDYPLNTKPCPIPGHQELAELAFQVERERLESLKRPYSPEEGNCPYCLAEGRPVGIECEHWNGLGWSKRKKNSLEKHPCLLDPDWELFYDVIDTDDASRYPGYKGPGHYLSWTHAGSDWYNKLDFCPVCGERLA